MFFFADVIRAFYRVKPFLAKTKMYLDVKVFILAFYGWLPDFILIPFLFNVFQKLSLLLTDSSSLAGKGEDVKRKNFMFLC